MSGLGRRLFLLLADRRSKAPMASSRRCFSAWRSEIILWIFMGRLISYPVGYESTREEEEKMKKRPGVQAGAFYDLIGRRPTLPHTRACSTIGAEELNYRVRDGNGWASSLLSPETFRTAQYGRGLKFAALSSSEISLSSGSHPRTFALNPVSIEAN